VLASLKPVSSAFYDSRSAPSGCLENTRTDVLEKMLSWANDLSPSMSVFWLAGLAGTGKSTIAKTFCERVAGPHTLLATFFASRNSADRRDPFNIIHTFAHQLAVAHPVIRPHILSTLRSPPDIHERPMKEQIERLLTDPFARQLDGRTIVLVIDALDECEKIGRVEGGALIPLLVEAFSNHPMKLLVTSRQETSLVGMFNSLTHIPLRLHEIETTSVNMDVRRILESGFADIRREHGLMASLWPSQEELDALVGLTGRFLIFATTALRYIGDDRFDPVEQLRGVLARGATLEGEAPYAQIDALYRDILHAATRDSSGYQDTLQDTNCGSAGRFNLRLCKRVGLLLRTIVLLEEPLSVPALAQLIGASMNVVAKDISALAAILLVADNTADGSSALVQIFHPSLRDFLLDPQRCRDNHLVVASPQHEYELAKRCLLVMNQHLTRNICHIDNFTTANSDIPDISARILKYVPEALQYACVAWSIHLTSGDCPGGSLLTALVEFVRNHLLHWLELMSLLARLSTAAERLPTVLSWCRAIRTRLQPLGNLTEWKTISDLVEDAHRMLRVYYTPIESHALHIYHSALTTMPHCALLDLAQADLNSGIRLLSARDSGWGPALQVIEGHTDWVSSVIFSPDGLRIISGSYDRTVRIWNTMTGRLLTVCDGHTSRICSIALSPEGTKMISGSYDKTARIWDTRTGAQLAVLMHEGEVLSVAFSPVVAQIVSASFDKLLRLWDATTGAVLALYEGHTGHVNSVAFSFDGTKIASASNDCTVRIWDARYTHRQPLVLEGHNLAVNSVAFSHSRAHVVSASNDKTVRLWDAKRGHQLLVLQGHDDKVHSATFGPADVHVFSGSSDYTVRVWDSRTGEQLAVLDGHISDVLSVASSRDGCHIASGSLDTTIVVWDWSRRIRRQSCGPQNQTNLVRVSCVALSWSGAQIASGHWDDHTVRLWDADTGVQLAVLEGHESCVQCVAFSQDGKRIASGSEDETLRIWNTGAHPASMHSEVGLIGHRGGVVCVALSSNGALVASGSRDTVTIWDIDTKCRLSVLYGGFNGVDSIAFSPDGAKVAATSSLALVVWNTRTFQELAVINVKKLYPEYYSMASIAFTADGNFLQARTPRSLVFTMDLRRGRWCPHHAEGLCRSESCRLAGPSQMLERFVLNSPSQWPHGVACFWNQDSGWLSCLGADGASMLHICWLPMERRGWVFSSRGPKVVLGGERGKMTVLDLANTVAALRCFGVL
jgi:WD40 repeat protein